MAIVHFVKSKRTQTVGGLNAVINYCCKDAKVDYQGRPLISGINCVPQCALQEFMNTKRLHHSTQGRMYYHMVQSFRPDDPVTPEQAHEIALKLAEKISGFEIVVATHTDRDHIHSHFVINSVSCDTGLKYVSYKPWAEYRETDAPPHFYFMEVMPMMLIPIWERERNRLFYVDSITSLGTVFSVSLSIAFRNAFGYCVCCKNPVTVPANRKVR